MYINLWSDIFIDINQHTEIKKRIEPVEIHQGSSRAKIARIVEEEHHTYSINRIITHEDLLIVSGMHVHELIDLLNTYIAGQLEHIIYSQYDEHGNGFTAKLAERSIERENKPFKEHSLNLNVSDRSYFLKKYDCRIIVSKFNKIYSKCLPYGF